MPKTVAEIQMAIEIFKGRVESQTLPFPLCRTSTVVAKKFYSHLASEFAVENFDFLGAAAHYSGEPDKAAFAKSFCPTDIKSLVPKTGPCAAAIWNRFLGPNPTAQVNVAGRSATALALKLNANGFVGVLTAGDISTLFNECESDVNGMMTGPWSRFIGAWEKELDADLVKAKKPGQASGAAQVAAGLAKATPILAKLRSHQKTKLAGSLLSLRGKHPSGKFVLFPKSLDGVPTLLTSSAVDKEVDAKYVESASAASSTVFPVRKGLWLRHMGANKVETYWVEDNPAGTAQLFGQALVNMGINTATRAVSLSLLQAELLVKQPKKAAAIRALTKPLALLLSAEAGVEDRTKMWASAKTNAKKAMPEAVFVVAEREFTALKLTEALSKVVKGHWPDGAYADKALTRKNKHWVVVHSSPDADRDPKLFGGVWLYKGVTKPVLTGVGQFVGKQQSALPPGWLVVVTQAEAKAALDAAFAKKKDEMIRADLARTGLV